MRQRNVKPLKPNTMNTIIIKIENLKCHGCANTITKGLTIYEEVDSVEVSIEDSAVTINYSENENQTDKYRRKLKRMGYPERGNNNVISTAKSYVSCAIGRISEQTKPPE
jgi:copper chaperone CopZ